MAEGINRTYHRILLLLLRCLLRHNDVQILPDIVLELPDVNPLGALRILDRLRADTSPCAVHAGQQVLLAGFDARGDRLRRIGVVHIVEAGRIVVVVVVEELRAERDRAAVLRCGKGGSDW